MKLLGFGILILFRISNFGFRILHLRSGQTQGLLLLHAVSGQSTCEAGARKGTLESGGGRFSGKRLYRWGRIYLRRGECARRRGWDGALGGDMLLRNSFGGRATLLGRVF